MSEKIKCKVCGYEFTTLLDFCPKCLTVPKSPQELEEVEIVRPALIEKWRTWDVPEPIIERIIRQKERIRELRRVEEYITLPDYAYRMPRLPEIEAQRWGFAKIIDTEGYIYTHYPYARDKLAKIDRWLYRYEYYRPRVVVLTRTYNLTEEIANLMHTEVTIARRWDIRIKAYAIDYITFAHTARAVRICYLTEPHLVVPHKKRQARQILTIYKHHPEIPRT